MGILYKGKITWVCLRWSLFSQWESHHLGNQFREYVQFCWSRNQVLICLDQLWSTIDLRGYSWNTRPGFYGLQFATVGQMAQSSHVVDLPSFLTWVEFPGRFLRKNQAGSTISGVLSTICATNHPGNPILGWSWLKPPVVVIVVGIYTKHPGTSCPRYPSNCLLFLVYTNHQS